MHSAMSPQDPAAPSTEPDRSDRPSSHLYRVDSGTLIPVARDATAPGPAVCAAHAAFRSFVEHPDYPCVGAKSALARSSYVMGVYPSLSEPKSAPAVVDDLRWFGAHTEDIGKSYVTFMAVFQDAAIGPPERFEATLWSYLQAMHRYDRHECDWDPAVSKNPRDPEFRFVVGGEAYFVIGLHPLARREARRFPFPMLVFNLHAQFRNSAKKAGSSGCGTRSVSVRSNSRAHRTRCSRTSAVRAKPLSTRAARTRRAGRRPSGHSANLTELPASGHPAVRPAHPVPSPAPTSAIPERTAADDRRDPAPARDR